MNPPALMLLPMLLLFYGMIAILFTIDVLAPQARQLMTWPVDRYRAWRFKRWVRRHPAWVRAMASYYANWGLQQLTVQELARMLAQLHAKEHAS